VGEVNREEEVSHVVEVNHVGVVEIEIAGVVSHVGVANHVVEVIHVGAANHVVEAIHEVGASHAVGHVMVEVNLENDVIQVHLLVIIGPVVDPNQECVGGLHRFQIVENQTDHVTLVDLEVKIEVVIVVAEVAVDIMEHHRQWHHLQCTDMVNLQCENVMLNNILVVVVWDKSKWSN